MAELNYQMMKVASQARESSELKTETRKRNLLVLIMQYLNDEGYVETSSSFSKECTLDFQKYDVCDNVDLETVLMEYESFYYIKFQKYPKIVKILSDNARPKLQQSKTSLVNSNRPSLSKGAALPRINGMSNSADSRVKQNKNPEKAVSPDNQNNISSALSIQGKQDILMSCNADNQSTTKTKPKCGQIIDIRSMINQETRVNIEDDCRFSELQDRLLKPLGGFAGYNSEWRELAVSISKDIYLNNPNVKWNDIVGLDSAKQLIKEAVVYPIKYPKLFQGILSPWKGILLYGPPGTGKTLLAKAVATECNTTFFNISASSIVSKWRGDSEKLVRILFELARFHAPSTIFIDELESVMSQRGSGPGGEHEGSRRMKTELLIQMDGLAKSDDLVFLLAASNLPWELDCAMLRRLEKRILVGLPTLEARTILFQNFLPPRISTDSQMDLRSNIDYAHLAEKTEGYSGSDIRLVCKEGAMKAIRKIFFALESHSEGELQNLHLDPINTIHMMETLNTTKPSAKNINRKYEAWKNDYESV